MTSSVLYCNHEKRNMYLPQDQTEIINLKIIIEKKMILSKEHLKLKITTVVVNSKLKLPT